MGPHNTLLTRHLLPVKNVISVPPLAFKPSKKARTSWLAMRDFTPGGITGALRRGYDRYCNKYINVRKGGLSGITMVLAGYVVVSYIWSYDHLKHDRHRKYH
nr:PREDICTED: ATP synthase subunit f, mitochondrial [Struthio camelus australis]